MPDVLKKFLTYGLGSLLQSALALLLLPLYLRYFTPEEYGVISALTVLSMLLALFLSAGAANGLIRLYYEAQAEARRSLAGATWLWYLLVAAAGGAALLWLAAPLSRLLFQRAEHAAVLRAAAAALFFSMLRELPFYLLRLEKRAGLFVTFSLFAFLADFALKLALIVRLGRGAPGYFESGALSSLLTLALILPFVARYVRLSLALPRLWAVLRLGAPFILSGLAIWTLDVSDRLLLARFSGPAAVGIYSLAYQFANLFAVLLATPVNLLIDPFFFGFAARSTPEQVRLLLRRTLIYYLLAGGAVYLMIALGSREVLRLLTLRSGARPEYLSAAPLIPALALAPLTYFLASQAGLAGMWVKKPEVISAASAAAAAINLGLNLFLIPLYGPAGAAFTTVLAYLLLMWLAYRWIGRRFPVDHDRGTLARGAACLAVAAAAAGWIRIGPPLAALLLRAGAGVGLFLLLFFASGRVLTPEEWAALRGTLASARRRLAGAWAARPGASARGLPR